MRRGGGTGAGAVERAGGAGSSPGRAIGSTAEEQPGGEVCENYARVAMNISSVSSGEGFACSIHRPDGVACCFGRARRNWRWLGPSGLGPVLAVSAGKGHVCAIARAGHLLHCWGPWRRFLGQTNVPKDLGPVEAVSAGVKHTCAIARASRALRCWGLRHPTVPAGLGPVEAVAAGDGGTCAIAQATGSLHCWGHVAAVPAGLGPVAAVSVGAAHTCAIVRADRSLRCWLLPGTALTAGQKGAAAVPEALGPVEAVVAGCDHTCAITRVGRRLRCWGGQAAEHFKPLGPVEAVSVGCFHTCVVLTSGRLQCGPNHAVTSPLMEMETTYLRDLKAQVEKERSAAEEGQRRAEQSRRVVQREKRAEEKAEAEKEMAMVMTEQSCSKMLTRQVITEISCKGAAGGTSYSVDVPDGFMLRGSPVQAYRCTNRGACLAGGSLPRRWVGSKEGTGTCPLVPSLPTPLALAMCAEGYDPQSPGCSRCREGHGRASTDPFVCKACGPLALQLLGFAVVPLSLFLVSMRGALARSQSPSGVFNDLLKIFLSFVSAATVVMGAVLASDSYQTLPALPQQFLSLGGDSVESSATYPRASTAWRSRRSTSRRPSC
ncbi:unnamed protein product [Prorocentrum cordatum]|uniref:non-specific serine/threonine protein kinase n=1 Tax=Prorocentrum cordatum TaxID=2364126 RepID=A0ABN9REJ5_9DINO|nr:unnamed protein product [Polarella glacialis]